MTRLIRVKRVHYAESSFVTDGRVADALLAYAQTLAIVGRADVVHLPGVNQDGEVRTFELVVGPASQIMAEDVDDDPVEMPVDEAITDLLARQQRSLPVVELPDFPGEGAASS